MMNKPFMIVVLAVCGWLAAPWSAYGQFSEGAESETIGTSSQAPLLGQKLEAGAVGEEIVCATNALRRDQGRQPVEVNRRLTDAAQYFAGYMAKNDKYGHMADGSRPAERAKQHGYEYCIVTENIAYRFSSDGFEAQELARLLVDGWKESPGHRANMLDADVMETGAAVAQSAKTGYYYAVQLFGRPKSQAIEFAISNDSGVGIHYKIGEREFSLEPKHTRTHQQCRPSEVAFYLSDSENAADQPARSLKPKDGARLAIEVQAGELRVTEK
jgi:uncharacterized protein YkwD